jgi:hypothetical protein
MRRSEVPSGQLLDGALLRAAAGVGLQLHPDLALRAEVGLEAGVGNSLRRMDAALLASLSLRAPLSVEVGPYLAGMGSASSQRGAALGLRARLDVGSAFGLGAVLAWNVAGSGSFAPRATPWLLVGADLTLESSVER